MPPQTLGFSLAVIGSFFFGIYMVPRKASRLPNAEFLWGMGVSVAICTFLFRVISGAPMFSHAFDWALSLVSGVMWFVGSLGYANAVRSIGLTRSTPIKNLGPIVTTLYGVFLFHEFSLSEPLPLFEAVSGSVLMTLSALVLGKTSAPENSTASEAFHPELPPQTQKRLFLSGVIWSLVAAICFSGYSIPMKLVYRHMRTQPQFNFQESAPPFLSAMGVGVAISALLYFTVIRKGKLFPAFPSGREVALSSFAGLSWALASVTASQAAVYIPMSISWPITNLSTLVGVALGVWLYHEVHLEKHRKEVFWGLVSSAAGIVLLALAMGRGRV